MCCPACVDDSGTVHTNIANSGMEAFCLSILPHALTFVAPSLPLMSLSENDTGTRNQRDGHGSYSSALTAWFVEFVKCFQAFIFAEICI